MKAMSLMKLGTAVLATLLLAVGVARADLIFTAPPRESVVKGKEIYGPLADYLTQLLGTKVVYQHPEGWPQYTRAMREGKYDLVFDGPHFTSWRMAHVQHQPLVRLPGQLVFHLLAKADDNGVNSPQDLAGRRICGLAPPNLATMSVIRQFPNPARQPVIVPAKGGVPGVFKGMEEGKCRAAVVRTQFYDKILTDEQRAGVKILSTSAKYPNQSISAGPNVTDEQKQKIIGALTGDGAQAAHGIFERFARNAKKFVPTQPGEFKDINLLLEGVIWGW